MLLLSLILTPFIGSFVAACMPEDARNREAWLAGFIAVCGLVVTVLLYPAVAGGEVIRYRLDWIPSSGLYFSLRMDGLSWVFMGLIHTITLLVVLYARYYMSPKDPVPRFFSFLMAFMGSMVGVVLSGNLIQMVMFWELTSLASFLLISYWHHRADARRGARMALTVTATGGLCLLAGVLLLGHIVGSYELDQVLAAGDLTRAHPWYVPTFILIALGALTKSAQFPFHFWLPHAMAAPTPVSAYLHSATMVKAGIFLLIRLWPILSGTQEWTWIVAGAGICTMLLGSFMAIFQHDLKGLLAYSTISHLGLITVLLGIGSPLAMVAAIFHTLNHATFKASLFMAVGIIDHESGTRDMRKLRGLGRMMPYTATLAIIASCAMAGVPLLNGFISKEMFFSQTLAWGYGQWMSIAAVVYGIFSVAYSLRFMYVFFGAPAQDLPSQPHEPPRWMRFPVEFLVLCCLIVGIIPGLSIGPLLQLAVESVLGSETPAYSLAIWHGFNTPLLMSIAAMGLGVMFYVLLRRYANLIHRDTVPLLHRFSGAQAYESVLLNLSSGAAKLEKWFSARRIQPQIFLILSVAVVLTVLTWPHRMSFDFSRAWDNWDPWFAILWLMGCACAVAAAWQAKFHRLRALSLLGGTGIITSITFLGLSAPDLALTQLMVETVTTILILLGLRWLPPRLPPKDLNITITGSGARSRRSRDLLLAFLTGLGMAALSYGVMINPHHDSIGEFFVLRALSEGGGSNVVNVLLVDFRGFDTMGEICVLAIVSLTVYALLRRFRPAPESIQLPSQQRHPADPAHNQPPVQQATSGYLMVPGVYLRLLSPVILVIAAYLFMRGHNMPGGGFVAGLTFAVAIILQYMLAGTTWIESRLHLRPHRWLSFGLTVAVITGAGAWVVGYPFLTSHTAHLTLPVLGEIHIPSAFVFDVGVFAVVVGSTVLILVALAHQSLRGHRHPGGQTPPASPTLKELK
jgi:multicomponent K+:H+ antiporter subunit A